MKYSVKIDLICDFPESWIQNYILEKIRGQHVLIENFEFIHVKEKPKRKKIGGYKYPYRNMKIGEEYIFPREYTRKNLQYALTTSQSFARGSKDCKHYKFTVIKKGDQIILKRIR